ncbi:dihydroorotate dehydrogenase [Dellaglioa sp. BT-FLS60]
MVEERLAVTLAGIHFKNPIMPASGCFGFGDVPSAKKYDLDLLGGIITKTATMEQKNGNEQPQIMPINDGILNSVGLKNPGIDAIVTEKIPALKAAHPDLPIIASVAGATEEEYVTVAKSLNDSGLVTALELNVSCPNVDVGGMLFGTDPEITGHLVAAVKKVTTIPVFVKLTPNVTDITKIAIAAETNGADGFSLINTVQGMKIDIHTRKSVLGRQIGGLSGAAIKPIAVRMVYEVSRVSDLPIIAMGGIETVDDVIEMYLAGASAVGIGSAHFKNAMVCPDLIEALPAKLDELNIKSLAELITEVRESR